MNIKCCNEPELHSLSFPFYDSQVLTSPVPIYYNKQGLQQPYSNSWKENRSGDMLNVQWAKPISAIPPIFTFFVNLEKKMEQPQTKNILQFYNNEITRG